MNFAEAALLIQGFASVYSKKVCNRFSFINKNWQSHLNLLIL